MNEDRSMEYGVSTTSDSNILCTCGHGGEHGGDQRAAGEVKGA